MWKWSEKLFPSCTAASRAASHLQKKYCAIEIATNYCSHIKRKKEKKEEEGKKSHTRCIWIDCQTWSNGGSLKGCWQ